MRKPSAVLALPVLLAAALAWTAMSSLSAAPQAGPVAAPTAASAPAEPAVETTAEGCTWERFTVPSPSMKREIRAAVLLPPGYKESPDRKYPVLYALHGSQAPYDTWLNMSSLRKALATRPMIVAVFDGEPPRQYTDATTRPDSGFSRFFFSELAPFIEARYRANEQRGVTGFSMGGGRSFQYMIEKPDFFTSVSALSTGFGRWGGGRAATRPGAGPEGPTDGNRPRRPSGGNIIAGFQKAFDANVKLPPLMIGCGTEDVMALPGSRAMNLFLIERNAAVAKAAAAEVAAGEAAAGPDRAKRDKLAAALSADRRINYLYVESPGAHHWRYWRDTGELVLDFHWRSFRDTPVPAPTARP